MDGCGRYLVLVVDDDEGIREALALVLEMEGFVTIQAADGEAAIDVLRTEDGPPAVVVLDISMSRRDGAWALECKALDARLARVPDIVWSAAGNADLPANAGVQTTLAKPTPIARLVAEVKRAAHQSDVY